MKFLISILFLGLVSCASYQVSGDRQVASDENNLRKIRCYGSHYGRQNTKSEAIDKTFEVEKDKWVTKELFVIPEEDIRVVASIHTDNKPQITISKRDLKWSKSVSSSADLLGRGAYFDQNEDLYKGLNIHMHCYLMK